MAEAEVLARDDDLRAGEPLRDELLRLLRRRLERERDHDDVGGAVLAQQLDAPLRRADQLDLVPVHHRPRVRVERERGDRQPRLERDLEHASVTQVHPVERADDDGAGHGSSASASSVGTIRSSSASSTRNGPTSVRRNVRQ